MRVVCDAAQGTSSGREDARNGETPGCSGGRGVGTLQLLPGIRVRGGTEGGGWPRSASSIHPEGQLLGKPAVYIGEEAHDHVVGR